MELIDERTNPVFAPPKNWTWQLSHIMGYVWIIDLDAEEEHNRWGLGYFNEDGDLVIPEGGEIK